MEIPTGAEIEAIRERRSKITPPPWIHDAWAVGSSSHFITQPTAEHRVLCECKLDQTHGMDHHPRHDFEFIESAPDDIDMLLAALDAANDKLKRAQSAIRFTLASEVYDFDLVEGCESLCASLSDEEMAHADTLQLWLKAKAEVEGVLAAMPPSTVVRVREGGGPENLWASLAVSVAKLVFQLHDVISELVTSESERHSLGQRLDAVTEERDKLL
jgi:hypothetical protein